MPTDVEVTKGLSEAKLQEFATKINKHLKRIGEDVLAIGELLLDAKTKAGHGQFERLFRDYDGPEGPVKNPIPMSHRYANSYMRIAEHKVLASPAHAAALPHAVSTLLVLAKSKDVKKVEEGFAEDVIRPTMSAAEARAFLRKQPKLVLVDDKDKAKSEIRKKLKELFERFPKLRNYIVTVVSDLIDEFPAGPDDESEDDEEPDEE